MEYILWVVAGNTHHQISKVLYTGNRKPLMKEILNFWYRELLFFIYRNFNAVYRFSKRTVYPVPNGTNNVSFNLSQYCILLCCMIIYYVKKVILSTLICRVGVMPFCAHQTTSVPFYTFGSTALWRRAALSQSDVTLEIVFTLAKMSSQGLVISAAISTKHPLSVQVWRS